MVTYIDYEGKRYYINAFDDDFIGKLINGRHRFYEQDELDCLRKIINVNKDNIALDIGCNIGNHAIFFKEILGYKEVIGYEPFPITFDILERNALKYEFTVHNKLIGDGSKHERQDGIPTAYAYRTNKRGLFEDVIKNYGAMVYKQSDSENAVESVRLDDIIFNNKIDLIKIDVECMEIIVLKGMIETIKNHRPYILIESYIEGFLEMFLRKFPFYENCLDFKSVEPNFLFIPKN